LQELPEAASLPIWVPPQNKQRVDSN